MEILGALLVLALVAHPLITPIVLIFWHRSLAREVKEQDQRLAQQRIQIAQLEKRLAAWRTGAPPEEAAPEQPATEGASETIDIAAAGPAQETPPPVEPEKPAPEAARTPVIKRPAEDAPAKPARPAADGKGFEKALTSSWMVWLGAVAVGLSAVFLFTYAIEQGWLGPVQRVGLGLLLGVVLVVAGEWSHRRSLRNLPLALKTDYVPPALTASGVFVLYVSFFAAYAQYDLLSDAMAFVALASVSFAGLVLAIRQGAFVAIMALAGGYLVPVLSSSDAPRAEAVFLYLFILTAACLALMMYRKWWFLAFATLLGALGWPILWLLAAWSSADQGAVSAYVVGVGALFAIFSVHLPVKTPERPVRAWLVETIANTSGLGFALSGVNIVILAIASDYNEAAFVFLGLFAAMGLAFGIRRAAYESLAVTAVLALAVAVFLWPQPPSVSLPEELQQLGVESYRTAFGPFVMPPEFLIFARALVIFALGLGLGALAAMRSAATPPVWGAIAAGAPIYFFVIGYWRIGGFEIDIAWAAIALGLAAFNLLAAAYSRRKLTGSASDICVGFFATGCTTALSLTFACLLREAWLTVAISLEVLALAWLWSELRIRELRMVALVAVVAVMIRLTINQHILDYDGGGFWAFSWVLYGYGVPALALHLATRFLGPLKSDPLAALCEIAAIVFGFLMVAFQLRIWSSGAIYGPSYDLFSQSVQTAWWIVAAGLLLRRELVEKLPQAWHCGVILLILASLQIVYGHLLVYCPLWTGDPVGSAPLFNLLGLAYLVPALLLWGLGQVDGFRLDDRVRKALRIAATFLVFVYVTLEVRRSFQGSEMGLTIYSHVADAEIYAYSAVWIAYSLALLAVGILQKSSFWRYSSLAVLMVTVLKIFLYDMSDLTGLFRVASFLGLGLTLIGIGSLYRRFVFR